jgi:subfamily B ATP-binding cassette protein MsbA|uniref:Lipid A export permease/ATP-binding protein MsbA n=1 Tax=Desulfobacca acetoxidans TaxID=60893 RepID=A0A7V6A0X4_9BACT
MKKADLRLYFRLLTYVKLYWPRFLGAAAAMLLVSGITALLAYLVKPFLDDVFFKKNLQMLYLLPPLLVALYAAKGGLSFFHTYQMHYIGLRLVTLLRDKLFRHLQRQPHAFFDREATAVLMSRVVYDVLLLQDSVARVITSFFKDVFTLVGLTVVIFYQDWQLALIAILVFPIAGCLITRFGQRLRNLARESQKSVARLNLLLQENFTGQRIVKAFAREDFEAARFAGANEHFRRVQMKLRIMRELSSPVMELLGALGMAVIISYGGYHVIQGSTTPGTFFSFLAALLMLYAPIRGLGSAQNSIQEALAAAQRVFSVLDLEPAIVDRPGAPALAPLTRDIAYREVSFSYGEELVLQDINFTVRKGDIVALVGPSGAGKTTLLNLLPRFYEVTTGAILIDGVDIREVSLASLRAHIGVVTQQTILFNETVRYNVAYGRLDATEPEIIQALRAAHAYDFVMALPQGLDTVIGEQGVRLSGGERQRLAIARALLKDPPILILDEATSSLDSEAEREVQQALDRLIAGRTTLVIAHRLSTARHADRLIVMDGGHIVEMGTHDELLGINGLYKRLYDMQFAWEEKKSSEGDFPKPAERLATKSR